MVVSTGNDRDAVAPMVPPIVAAPASLAAVPSSANLAASAAGRWSRPEIVEALSLAEFDQIAALATRLLDRTAAMIALADGAGCAMLAHAGVGPHNSGDLLYFCALVAQSADATPVRSNDGAASGSFAGVRLIDSAGSVMGAIAVMDARAGLVLSAEQARSLQDLAGMVADRIEKRLALIARLPPRATPPRTTERA